MRWRRLSWAEAKQHRVERLPGRIGCGRWHARFALEATMASAGVASAPKSNGCSLTLRQSFLRAIRWRIGARYAPRWLQARGTKFRPLYGKPSYAAAEARSSDRGTARRSWRTHGAYRNARELLHAALIEDQLAATTRPHRGVTVMTIHKAKGKEFDEVIVFEGMFQRYLQPRGADAERSARFNLHVAVTRARAAVTIMTPSRNPCRMLSSFAE